MRAFHAALLFAALGACANARAGTGPTRQQHVHDHAHQVMPFDIARVEHVFRMTSSGGSMRVVLRTPDDAAQLPGIRSHLRELAASFSRGDYGKPGHLHGEAMPGLAELRKGAGDVKVDYAELADGAEIRLHASDLELVTAVHRWFGAQLSEHGADARAE